MTDLFVKERILRGSGVVVLSAILLYGLGITWSCLFAITFWALYVIIIRMADDSIDERKSIENLEGSTSSVSEKKRILLRKKEKYEKRKQAAIDTDTEDELDTGLKRSQELIDESIYGSIDYEAAAAYHGVFAMSNSDSRTPSRRYIPSLKSPQPLLSAFQSRISRREYNAAMSPKLMPHKSYPLSPKSVFDNFHNRSVISPMNRSGMRTETYNVNKTPSFDAQRAVSPPSGRYFSRIRPGFQGVSKRDSEIVKNSVRRGDKTMENQAEMSNLDDSCSKEAIIKVLQEKTANKRKRLQQDILDTPTIFQDKSSKKRRIDDSPVDEAVIDLKRDRLGGEGSGMCNTRAPEGQAPPGCGFEHSIDSGSKENKEVGIQMSNKYGLKDSEVESIKDDANMEIDKAQMKRKGDGDSETTKGKKVRGDKVDASKRKEARQTPVSQSKKKKATPMRSIETQTPTKFEQDDNAKKSPRTPNVLKTPYKKVFVSGFPSNLKPESTEKRRKIPIYSGGFRYNENIEIGLEEYGSLGVTSAAYTADKKAAMERVMSFFRNENDADSEKEREKENAPASLAVSNSEIQPLVVNQTSNASNITTSAVATPLDVSSQITLSLMPASFTLAPSTNPQISIDTLTSSSQKTESSCVISASMPVTTANGIASDSRQKSSIPKSEDKISPFSFGSPTAASSTATATITTTTPTLVTSSVPSLVGFVKPQQSSVTFGGLNFSSQFSSNTATASTSAPSITFGQPSNAPPSTQTSDAVKSTTEKPSLSQPSQLAASGFGGFNFSASIASSQSLQPQTISAAATTSSIDVVKPAIGFSFGMSQQKIPSNDIRTQTSSETPISSTLGTLPKVGGFGFGTTVPAAPQASLGSTFGGFKFGANPTSVDSTTAVSSINTTVGGFKFGATTSAAPSFGGFSIGSGLSSQAPKVGSSVSGSLSGSVNLDANGQATAATTTSIFQSPSNNLQSTFSSKSTAPSIATNLFGTPTTSIAFGSQPQFGTGQGSAPGHLFATPSCAQTAPLFGVSTQSTSSIAPTFGSTPQSSNTVGSIFTVPSLGANASGTLLNAISQVSSSGAPVFGATTQNVNTGSTFNAASQSSQQSGLLFGAQQKTTAAPIFGIQAPSSSFSFGTNQNTALFGSSAKTGTAAAGGFSFTSNSQADASSNKAITQFGQSGGNSFGQFGAQNNPGSNPFASAPAFGQVPAVTSTNSSFAFGAATAPAFGQTSSSQSSFGAAPATFQPVVDQPQTGGFNFAAVAAQKPASFSFGGTSSGGFTSRPGTPTPFNNPPAPAADIFTSPQTQGTGFVMGTGSRPTVRAKRRARR